MNRSRREWLGRTQVLWPRFIASIICICDLFPLATLSRSVHNELMLRAEYERLKQRADAEHKQNLQAIERVWRMSQGSLDPTVNGSERTLRSRRPQRGRKRGTNGARKGALLKAVRTAVKGLHGSFSYQEVSEAVAAQSPRMEIKRSSLKGNLKKLVDAGELEIVVQGQGRRASQFKRT